MNEWWTLSSFFIINWRGSIISSHCHIKLYTWKGAFGLSFAHVSGYVPVSFQTRLLQGVFRLQQNPKTKVMKPN